MYAVQGRSWVSLGDPVGPDDQRIDLVWNFLELVERANGWPVFYQVDEQQLPLYLEEGLDMLKLGEEARVAAGRVHVGHRPSRGTAADATTPSAAKIAASRSCPRIACRASWPSCRASRMRGWPIGILDEKRFSLASFNAGILESFSLRDRAAGRANHRLCESLARSREGRVVRRSDPLSAWIAAGPDGVSARRTDALGPAGGLPLVQSRNGAAGGDRGSAAGAVVESSGWTDISARRAFRQPAGAARNSSRSSPPFGRRSIWSPPAGWRCPASSPTWPR